MYKCKKNKVQFLFLLLTVMFSGVSFGQSTLEKPDLQFTFACAKDGSNNFCLDFTYLGTGYDPNNVFTIQLSDPDGNFDTGNNRNLRTVTGQNNTFFVPDVCFPFPEDTYGFNYRIRVLSSIPDESGPPSDPFEAFFTTSEQLVLNDRNPVVLCGGSQTVSVNVIDPEFTYLWFKQEGGRDVLIPGETGSSLDISQPGRYYAAINYGDCTQSGSGVRSNFIDVTEVAPTSLNIGTETLIQICANETHQFIASVDDPSFTYNWFKDDVRIDLPPYTPTYTTPSSNQFGIYRLEIEVGGCNSVSQNVTVEQRAGASFDVTIENPATRVRLPRETINLTIDHNASSSTITWFKDGVALPSSNSLTFPAVEEGVYCAEVVDNSSSCPTSKKSPEYTVLDVVSIEPMIRAESDYVDCTNESTTLSISGVNATATDGNTYSLTQDQIDTLTFQWSKDGTDIAGATLDQLDVDSYNDNGSYVLNATISATMNFDSMPLDVLLTLTGVEIQSSSVSNALCPGETITFNLNIVSGFTYRWFKDGVELVVADPSTLVIDEIGVYSVTYEGFGCLNNVAEINVVEFDESVLEVSPSSTAVLEPGETITLEASGADSYEWFNEAGTLLSSNETLDVNTLGTFTVFGTVGGCRAQRDINVVEDDGKLVIPNIITPFNSDGVNDTWELPNRFAFQDNVQVIIYNSRGKEVLNTTDYQNDWPVNNNLKDGMLFYFRVIRDNNIIKSGTISILQ
ncbi:T9SS type B sorting domain-containing protein [Tenacibaculum jejuense]|uniref:Putative adhesin SprC n=1 Tax=Tenacibaculum jejuense TaxID=584609 RepID=A0A238UD48_9FLAO|nr:gliding motility-associated C-terminal domain-containing protein [Tenacibaculum jejuense]SNR16330.1 Putative adhesin precursor SprC [Tenacibaculum jejuense]